MVWACDIVREEIVKGLDRCTALEQQARAGDVEAQYELGMMYLKGRGVEKEPERAYVWLGKAAKQGYAKAITRMAILHHRGEIGLERVVEGHVSPLHPNTGREAPVAEPGASRDTGR